MQTNRIKVIRKEAGLSQRELGNELGVAQTTVSAWESGRNEPDYESIRKMARILETSAEYLMGYSDTDIPEGMEGMKISQDLKNKLVHHERQTKYNPDFIQEIEDEYGGEDDKILAEIKEEQHYEESYQTWEKTGMEIYRETAEIDVIFEEYNVDIKGRRKAVNMVRTMFEE